MVLLKKKCTLNSHKVLKLTTEGHIYKLKNALYGFKKYSRAWYGRIDSFLMSLGFTKSKVDPNL